MRRWKCIAIVAIIGSVFLLSGCAQAAKDKQEVVQWLDRTYGKDSYALEEDRKEQGHWIVTLNDYPKIPFRCNVFRDWLALGSPIVQTDFEEVFCNHAVKDFKRSHDMGHDALSYQRPGFFYETKIASLEDLKTPYDRAAGFVAFASERYPILVERELLWVTMRIDGITLKGDQSSDSEIQRRIAEFKEKNLSITSYEALEQELRAKQKTHAENAKGFAFGTDNGKSFVLGSDTLEDCLYKGFVLEGSTSEALKGIVLQPGEKSEMYVLKSENTDKLTTVSLQAQNRSGSPCSALDATVVKAVVSNSENIRVDRVWVELEGEGRKDPYKTLKIAPPKTEKEKAEGVPYRTGKILFEMRERRNEVKSVTLTFPES